MFPRSLRLKSGNIEIAFVGGKRFLRATSDSGAFEMPLPETLPKRFTLEFDYAASGNSSDRIYFSDASDSDTFFIGSFPLGSGLVVPKLPRCCANWETQNRDIDPSAGHGRW